MGMVDGAITDGEPSEMFTVCVLLGCRLLSWTCLSRAWRCWQTLSHVQRRVHVHNFGKCAVWHLRPVKMPEQESVSAFSAHRQAHVNTSRVVDRVTVWEIFLLVFLQDLNLVFVPVCVKEAQCVRFTIWTHPCFPNDSVNLSREQDLRTKGGVKMRLGFWAGHGAVVSLARSLLEYFSTCLVTSSNPKLCRKKKKAALPHLTAYQLFQAQFVCWMLSMLCWFGSGAELQATGGCCLLCLMLFFEPALKVNWEPIQAF